MFERWRAPRGGDLLPVPRGFARLPDGARRWVWAFALDAAPVTNGAFRAFMAATGCARPPWMSRPGFDDPEQPVVGVTLAEARAFARWARKRLPTRAEWWRAVGADGPPWGRGSPEPTQAIFRRPAGAAPAPRANRPASPYGHADLHGNVWEWGDDGICRGGFWGSPSLEAARLELVTPAETRSAGIGLRCAR